MGARFREGTKHVFDCFLEIAPARDEDGQPWILQTFPASLREKEADKLKEVSHFAFPCKVAVETVQHFSFVLTNLEAKWTFGFCRLAPNCETALVFLSCLPWHELFYKLLNHCAELIQSSETASLNVFLEAAYRSSVPGPGLHYHVEYGAGRDFTCPTPNPMNLPSVPENRNLTEYINAVDMHNMLLIFAAILHERRIVVISKKLSRLSACVQAANALIYPMCWENMFIPLLPGKFIQFLNAPMPFLIGVPEQLLRRVPESERGELVILNADNNHVETPFPDLDSLPVEVVANLKKSLKSPSQMLGDSVARAFLQALVHLIGGYRDGLKYRSGGKIEFDKEAFVRSRSSSIQPFLEKMWELQIFQQFIKERLDLLNSGRGFSDEFELECVAFTDKPNRRLKTQYAAITQNVRKESGAFVKAVKSKANPAVKDAVKTVKEGSKIAQHKARATYKDFKSRLRENREEIRNEEMDGGGANGSSSTHSAPSSPVQSRSSSSALDRYGTMTSSQFARQNTDLNFGRLAVRKYERFDPTSHKELSPEFEELPRLEYDLMSDLEEVMSRGKAEAGLANRNGVSLGVGATAHSSTTPPSVPSRPPPANHFHTSTVQQPQNHSVLKPSVGDLINLDAEEETELEVIFDPFATEPMHRKLSRTSGSSGVGPPPLSTTLGPLPPSRPSPALNTVGKYENYTPPAGASQIQFKQFLSSMTAEPAIAGSTSNSSRSASVRSSDDLLSEYGLHFGGLSLKPPIGGVVNSLYSDSNMGTVSAGAVPPLYTRPSFPTPPPRTAQLSSMPPSRPATSTATNSSFLYSSSQVFAAPPSDFLAPDAMPVNQRIRSSLAGLEPKGGGGSVGDILAELDPLRPVNPPVQGQQVEMELASGIKPPAVPPRVKKTPWTTFD